MSLAIKVENLSKAYQLGEIGTGTISQDFERWFAKVRGKEDPTAKIGENDRTTKGSSNMVWSLKDVNFEIEQGAAVGIIGRNGAGKSTLLKLLSRVTSPTTGEINVKGRIASLLEVGTGFHPELTGRENIYLNGAILGMRKKEIAKKFDEIVAFAGVERYIDTPVKRYSSGMYVRLAFGVAAHLESEILIVDEVLAVGDAEFQKKCIGKMGEVSKGEGRTVLFVSHNMASIQALCNKGIVLNNGKTLFEGSIVNAIQEYSLLYNRSKSLTYNGNGIIKNIRIVSPVPVRYNTELTIEVAFNAPQAIKKLIIGVNIKDELDVVLVSINNRHYLHHSLHLNDISSGRVQITFNPLMLLPGEYKVDLFISDTVTDLEAVQDAITFEIEKTIINDTSHPIDLRYNKIFMKDVDFRLNLD
jgi:lipopolysaccharide transport system ATP-binding protein